jgi:hypothetical protein
MFHSRRRNAQGLYIGNYLRKNCEMPIELKPIFKLARESVVVCARFGSVIHSDRIYLENLGSATCHGSLWRHRLYVLAKEAIAEFICGKRHLNMETLQRDVQRRAESRNCRQQL